MTNHRFPVRSSDEYAAVRAFYGERTARRSGIAYMAHIDEGLDVLDLIGASMTARLAFCLHPLAQADDDLPSFDPRCASSPDVLVAVIEYRNVANRYLAFHRGEPGRTARPSPLAVVNEMLVADKVQNRKDFEDHHASTSDAVSERLAGYFAEWLEALGVDEAAYAGLAAALRSRP